MRNTFVITDLTEEGQATLTELMSIAAANETPVIDVVKSLVLSVKEFYENVVPEGHAMIVTSERFESGVIEAMNLIFPFIDDAMILRAIKDLDIVRAAAEIKHYEMTLTDIEIEGYIAYRGTTEQLE